MTRRILMMMVLAIAASACGLRPGGNTPPLQVHPDMDNQPKFKAQSASKFYADGRSNRAAVPGTIAQGKLNEDDILNTGKDASGNLLKNNPVVITKAVLERGQERFNINCAPCHGRMGEGNGIVKIKSGGALAPANLQETRLREVGDGHIYDVITNGIRTMQPLGGNITVSDRWAITHYVRALQRSQNSNIKDVPPSSVASIKAADVVAAPATAVPTTGASPAASAASAKK